MARLIVTRGPNVGDSYVLTKRISTLGRDEACAVRIDRDGVSRNHAQICRDEDGWSVTDLGSTNGTIVNGEPVTERRLAAHHPHRKDRHGTTDRHPRTERR